MSLHRCYQPFIEPLPRAAADACGVSSGKNSLFMRDFWVLLASRQEGTN